MRVWLAVAAVRGGVSAAANSVPSAAPTSAAPTSAAPTSATGEEAQARLRAAAILSAVAVATLLVVALAFATVALALYVPWRRYRSETQGSHESIHARMLARSGAGGAQMNDSETQRRGEAESLPSYNAATHSDTVCAATTRSPMASAQELAARRQRALPPPPPAHAPNTFLRIFRRAQKRTASEEGWTKAWGLRPNTLHRLAPTSTDGCSAEEAPRDQAKRSIAGRTAVAAARASRSPPSVDYRSAKVHVEPAPPPPRDGYGPESGAGTVGIVARCPEGAASDSDPNTWPDSDEPPPAFDDYLSDGDGDDGYNADQPLPSIPGTLRTESC